MVSKPNNPSNSNSLKKTRLEFERFSSLNSEIMLPSGKNDLIEERIEPSAKMLGFFRDFCSHIS